MKDNYVSGQDIEDLMTLVQNARNVGYEAQYTSVSCYRTTPMFYIQLRYNHILITGDYATVKGKIEALEDLT